MATPIIMPRQGQSVESCILVEWLKDIGDSIAEGTPVVSIETDKAVFEVESPAAGTLVARFFKEGDDIPVLTNIAAVGEADEDASDLKPDSTGGEANQAAAPEATAPETAPAIEAAPAMGSGVEAVGVSPRARRRAAATGVDTEVLAGSGPGGRVIERDVEAAAAGRPRLSAAVRDAAAAGLAAPAHGSGPGGMVLSGDLGAAAQAPQAAAPAPAPAVGAPNEIPLTGIRKLIANKMHESLATTAQLTMNMSFNATGIMAYRASVKARGEALGLPNITINDLVAYATVQVLRVSPALNAHFRGDKTVQYPYVNLGVATDTDRGLMVPVVHGADRLSLSQLSAAVKPLIADAQKGSINPDLLQGGTFTITNMGMLGVESFTPVLNIPEVAILGVGGLSLKPVMQDGEVQHVQAINLSLTVDHQGVDGAPAAHFLKRLCTSLENFELTLAQ